MMTQRYSFSGPVSDVLPWCDRVRNTLNLDPFDGFEPGALLLRGISWEKVSPNIVTGVATIAHHTPITLVEPCETKHRITRESAERGDDKTLQCYDMIAWSGVELTKAPTRDNTNSHAARQADE